MPTLHVLQGPDKGRTFRTQPTETSEIGRMSGQVHLTDKSASRHHAELRPLNGSWILADLNSSNGTYLNGQRIVTPTEIKHGDQVRIGTTLMIFSGQQHVESITGEEMIRDLVDLKLDSDHEMESSILSAVPSSEDSVILQPPETADAVAAWNVVYKLAELMGTIESPDVFWELVADVIFDHLIVDRLILLMYDDQTQKLTPQVVRYRQKEKKLKPKIFASRTIINHVLENKAGVLCANAMNDARFVSRNKHDSIHRYGLRSIICVPVVAGERIHGVFHLDCSMSHHTYTQEQLRLAVAIGRITGIAVENSRFQESRVRTERLAAAGEAVAYLSHHIRNIVQGMQGGMDVLELGLRRKNFEHADSGWEMVRRNLDRIFHLTVNMLTFSKDRKPKIQSAQLNKIVDEVLTLAQTRAAEKGVTLSTDLGDGPPIPIDPEGMYQVIHNIVLNAIDACPSQGGCVNVATSQNVKDKQFVLAIKDNGAGIPAQQIEVIFDAFHSSKGHAGTGLGLAAAKKIVSELDGVIDIESTVGEGTTFYVTLPTVRARTEDTEGTQMPGTV